MNGFSSYGDAKSRAMLRRKGLFLLTASVLILLAHGIDLVQAHGSNWPALGVRIAWSALLTTVGAVLLRSGGRRVIRWAGAAASVGTALLYLALLAVTDRSRSPLLPFTFVLVIVLPLVTGEFLRVGIASSVLLLVGAGAMLFHDGAPVGAQLGWAQVGVLGVGVGWLWGLAELRTRVDVQALSGSREEALKKAAESEATARLAAHVAHEVNNPLAAAKATANFLRSRVTVPDAEVDSGFADLVSALDRIAALVRTLGPQRHSPLDDSRL